jgi:hypothetical protein
MTWRVGHKVPINVYEGDRPVCQCQTAEHARRIVEAMNAWNASHEPPEPDKTKGPPVHRGDLDTWVKG